MITNKTVCRIQQSIILRFCYKKFLNTVLVTFVGAFAATLSATCTILSNVITEL